MDKATLAMTGRVALLSRNVKEGRRSEIEQLDAAGEKSCAKFFFPSKTPLQQWGEEEEDGVIYSITLQRVRAEPTAERSCHLDDANLPDCSFVQYRTCKRRRLRAAALPELVKWLVSANGEGDRGYIPSFLTIYRLFATLEQVLELLLPLDKGVLCVLELWLQDHPEDFWEPPEYPNLHRILRFLHRSAPDSRARALAEKLLQACKEKKANSGKDVAETAGGESPGTGIRVTAGAEECEGIPDLLSFSVEEVAEQLTLMDAELFRAVKPFQCLGCIWSQRDKKENRHVAPSVRATVAQFNAVTSRVIASVLDDLTLRIPQRAHLLEQWISIAQHCRALRNFSSLHAILSALQSNPIYRLKRTWAAVNRDSRASFQKLSQIFSEENNHLNSREILQQEVGTPSSWDGFSSPRIPARASVKPRSQARLVAPTIPYLGTFLTDLIMLDTALPDFLEGNLVNFEKRRKEAEVLCWIRQLQESCQGYSLCPNPSFRFAFHSHRQLSEEQSYRISRMIEPPADSCPNSPKLHRSLTKRFSSLLSGSEASAAPLSPDKPGLSPWGSSSRLNSEEKLSRPCSPSQGPSTGKNLPVFQLNNSLLPEPPLPSPVFKQTGTDSRIIRVSMDNVHGNLYRSIVITSQDKTAAVVQRALQKHNSEAALPHNYQLLQLWGDGQELLIPDGANAFYAMNPAGPCDFVLRLKEGVPCPPAFRAAQSGSRAALRSTTTLKDLGTMAAAAASGLTLPQSPSHLGPLNSAPVCFPFPVMAPQHRSPSHLPSLLHPAPSSLSLNAQQPLDSPSSPPARLPHPSLTPEPFGPALPCSLLASPLQKPPSPASLEATVCSESPRNCVAPHFSAAQDGETVNRLAVLPNNGREVGP